MYHYVIVCKDTYQVLGHIPAFNQTQATIMARNMFHDNISVALDDGNNGIAADF